MVLHSRVAEIEERIATACVRAGRSREEVVLLAVTKTVARDVVVEALDAGLTVFGENRVQEAVTKYDGLLDRARLHLIGHLQSNKAKLVLGVFSCVESIDSLHTAQALSRRLDTAGSECEVLLQFNSSREATKYGYTDGEALLRDADAIGSLPGIRLTGVMTIGPFTRDTAAIADAFGATRRVYERLREQCGESIRILSMGMTNDYEIAIAEGSTEVRVGTAIFGARQ
jgi:pyridoxal phosphate enzyme (YggS family)